MLGKKRALDRPRYRWKNILFLYYDVSVMVWSHFLCSRIPYTSWFV